MHYTRQRRYGTLADPQSVSALDRWTAQYEVDSNGCWIWTGRISLAGYGQFSSPERKTVNAYRWGYEQLVGAIPGGLHLDHLCRVRACVNPAHLEPVTCRENVLRGVGVTAVNASKTHCLRGHEFTLANTRMKGRRRICRACSRAEVRLRRAHNATEVTR